MKRNKSFKTTYTVCFILTIVFSISLFVSITHADDIGWTVLCAEEAIMIAHGAYFQGGYKKEEIRVIEGEYETGKAKGFRHTFTQIDVNQNKDKEVWVSMKMVNRKIVPDYETEIEDFKEVKAYTYNEFQGKLLFAKPRSKENRYIGENFWKLIAEKEKE